MKILVSDYSGHAFPLELSQQLSKKNKVVHSYSQYFETPKANFRIKSQNPKLKIVPIKMKKKFKKDNFFLRRLMDISYGKKVIDLIKVQKPNIVICSNTPLDPLNKIISYCKESEIKSIFWKQDIYSVAIRDILNKKFPFFGFLVAKYYYYLEKKCEKLSDKIVVISKDFNNFISDENRHKIHYVENWSPYNTPRKKDIIFFKKKFNPQQKFCFIYSGTLGYKHNIDLFFELAKNFRNVLIIISSRGKFSKILKKTSKKKFPNIKIIDWINYNKFSAFLNIADAFIVNLNKESSFFSVPSKIYSYLTIGKPILASMPKENLASKTIIKFKSGLVSKPEKIQDFLDNAKKIINNYNLKKQALLASKKYLNSKNNSIHSMEKIIEKMSKKK